jgi:hypothetical protein
MPRSEASLARRAAKRGHSIEDQRKLDAERDRGYKGQAWDPNIAKRKRKSEDGVINTATSIVDGLKKQKVGELVVASGKESEIKLELELEPERETWTCKKCMHSENWTSRFKCRDCKAPRYDKKERKESNKAWVDPTVANNWKAPATEDKIQQNAALRKQYEQCKEAMSEEDRNRARILIERSARKKKKKTTRRQAFATQQSQRGGRGGGGRGGGMGRGGGGRGGGRGGRGRGSGRGGRGRGRGRGGGGGRGRY